MGLFMLGPKLIGTRFHSWSTLYLMDIHGHIYQTTEIHGRQQSKKNMRFKALTICPTYECPLLWLSMFL